MRFIKTICFWGAVWLVIQGHAQEIGGFGEWLQEFKTHAQRQGISPTTLNNAFKDFSIPNRSHVASLSMDWADRPSSYRNLHGRSSRGSPFLKKNRKKGPLPHQFIQKRYGVPYTILVAIWWTQSNFGHNPSNFIDALATLAYKTQDKDFFESLLLRVLRLMDTSTLQSILSPVDTLAPSPDLIPPNTFTTSQFDPALTEESLARIASYLHTKGWKEGETWGYEVTISPSFKKTLATLDVLKTPDEWKRIGVMFPARPRSELPSEKGSILNIDGRWFIVYHNFKVLLEWNSSINFALSVGRLSDQIHLESGETS